MLTIDNKLQQILGIKALSSVVHGANGAIRGMPEKEKPDPYSTNNRPNAIGRKEAI